MKHKCPVDNCSILMPSHLLMCARHWAMVPSSLSRSVYHYYRTGPVTKYLQARREVIDYVNALLAPEKKKEEDDLFGHLPKGRC